MLTLKNITLLGLDCVDLERLKIARDICTKDIEFGAVKLLSSIESDDKCTGPLLLDTNLVL